MINPKHKTIIILSALALVTAFAFGRWSAPEKVKIETKTVEVEKKTEHTQSDTDRNRKRETTKTEVTRPDGTVEKTEKTVDTTETHKETDRKDVTSTETTTEASKEVTAGTAKVTVAAMAGIDLAPGTRPPVMYGAMVSKPILGPITVGVWYLTAPAIGATVGLTF